MKFYYFNSKFPLRAVIWADDETKAIKKYEENICQIEDMDDAQKAANLGIAAADDVARDLQQMLVERSEAILDDIDFQTGGLAGLFWSIVTNEWPVVVWFEMP